MSKYEDGSYGSLTGIALIAKVLAGRCKMNYTRAAVGSGTIPDDMTPKTMTGCADYVMDAKIAGITNPVDGECQVTIQIKSDDVEKGFYATNIVLFAEDPDDGEVAYTYLSLENEPEWIRPASSIVGKLATFDLIAAVGDVDTVTAVIDPESIATIGEVKELIARHEEDEDAHSDEINELIAAHNADPNAHGGALGSGGVRTIEAEIASDDWQEDSSDANGYGYYFDITDEDTTASDSPFVTLSEDSLLTAYEAGMCQTATAYNGYIRLKCTERPSDAISAVCALYSQSSSSSGSSSYTLSPATTSTLGGVIIGDGLTVTSDGTASVNSSAVSQEAIEAATSSDEDTEAMLDEVFGATDADTDTTT